MQVFRTINLPAKYGRALFWLGVLVLNLGATAPMDPKKPFTGSDYWFYSHVADQVETTEAADGTVAVKYLYQNKWHAYTIHKDEIDTPLNRKNGFLRAFHYYMDRLKQARHPVVGDRIEQRLAKLTAGVRGGKQIEGYRHWKAWFSWTKGLLIYADCFQGMALEAPPELYWARIIFKEPLIVTKERDKDGYLCFRLGPVSPGFVIKADKTRGHRAKTDGFKQVLKNSMWGLTMAHQDRENLERLAGLDPEMRASLQGSFAENEQQQKMRMHNLNVLTGLEFQTAEEWLDWYKANKDRLELSEAKGHLVVKHD